MIRKFFIVMALVFCSSVNAQQGSASPYSFFGIGELRFRGVAENQMMGGISVYADSIGLNLRNPATYAGLKYTAYSIGTSYTSFDFTSNTSSEATETYAFDHLALGFPLSKKMGVGFGIVPFTSVGYRLSFLNEAQEPNVFDRFSGEGGVNRVFLSLGYAITKNLHFGITGNYDFGRIENRVVRATEGVQLGTREINSSQLRGFDINLSLNYNTKINDKLTGYATFIFSPEADLSSENEREFSTVTFLRDREVPNETQQVDLEALGLARTDLTLPTAATLGLAIGERNKWFFGAEYELKKTSNFENPFLDINRIDYEDATRFSAGGFFVPQFNSFSSYWKRVTYRAGIRYEETGIRVNNLPVNDFGITFGLGLPLGLSKVNVGFEVGRRGTTSANRVEENYFRVNLSLSLIDRWFEKNKYQ